MNGKNNRSDRYTFTSEKSLVSFFSDTFTKKEIKDIIAKNKRNFVQRDNTDKELHRLQILKKCEWELVRMAKEIKRDFD